MSLSKRSLQQARKEQRELKLLQAAEAAEEKEDPNAPEKLDPAIVQDPIAFCRTYLKFNPTPYQEKLLLDESKRIYVCWSRQSGKSTTLAARMIQRCLQYPGTLRLIVAPGLRQSMIMMDKIQDFIYNIPKPVRREIIGKV